MSPRLLITVALAASMAPWASATVTRATAPVGFMRYDVKPGLQTIGFPLLNAAAVISTVESVDATSIFAHAIIGANLEPARAYYLEFTAGPDGETAFVGDRIEIDVARTTDAANPASRIRLQLSSSFSTLRALPHSLAGYHFTIRPHVTLAEVLEIGTSSPLHAGCDTATADQAYLLQNGTYSSFLLQDDPSTGERHWVKFPEGNIADDLPIAPGTGLFVRHVGSEDAILRHVGDVRTNAFVQPLNAGATLIAEPFPVENTFETRGMTQFNGFIAGAAADASDNVSVWTGESYRTLFYAAGDSTPGWKNVEATAQSALDAGDTTFSPFHAVLVHKLTADRDYVVPSPF